MDLQNVALLKNRIAKTAEVFCILFLLCALDGGVAYLREPANSLRLLQGQSSGLTGPLAPGAESPAQMNYESTSDSISISIEEVMSEFWMGGMMWRGTVWVAPDAQPGHYEVSVFGAADRKRVGSNMFKVVVYKDRASYLADSNSVLQKNSGVNPWILAAGCFGLVVLCCAGLYIIAGKKDRLMAEQGEAEVYHLTRDEHGTSVYFGLGERHGIKRGAMLVLLDNQRRPVEEIMVDSVGEKDSHARVGPQSMVKPGYLVKKI